MPASVDPSASTADLDALARQTHRDPHGFLGAHPVPGHTVLRVLRPDAVSVSAVIGGVDYPMAEQCPGLFVGVVAIENLVDYRYRVRYRNDESHDLPGATREFVIADPYRFLPSVADVELADFAAGRHRRLWELLGAQVRQYTTPDGTVRGVAFTVWAPDARGVTVVGAFENWAGRAFPMRLVGSSGVWELFIPDLSPGDEYKFRVHGADGVIRDLADPMARRTALPSSTASVVDASSYCWRDSAWVARRDAGDPVAEPMSIYEVHLGSWRVGLSYRELAVELGDYLVETGFTHVEFLPVAEHPYGGSWGYQITSFYAPTSRFGSPDEFRHLVDELHRRGVAVLIDWVPAHFPKDDWALRRFDGTPLYEHRDPLRREQPDWGTYSFDLARHEVRNFLIANALYWCAEFHIDGLRVDAVASMLYLDYSRSDGQWRPNVHGGRENLEAVAFFQEMNDAVHQQFPGVATIAEESTAWPGVTRATALGGLGFTLKWNMGWMHDTLGYLGCTPDRRSEHHRRLTFPLTYAWSENFLMPISHDEVVHGKGTLWTRMPGDRDQVAAGIRILLAFMWSLPGKQLLFMGQEFGQVREWADDRSLDWEQCEGGDRALHAGIAALVGKLNRIYRCSPSLYSLDSSPRGFAWLDADDTANNVVSYLRHGSDGSVLAVVINFSGNDCPDYRIGLPQPGEWRIVLDTDDQAFGGSGARLAQVVEAVEQPWQGCPVSTSLALPANTAVWLSPGM